MSVLRDPEGTLMTILRLSVLLAAAAAAVGLAQAAQAQALKEIARISIPEQPINQYGVLTIDQTSGLGYLADKDNKAAVVFDTKANTFVSRITGFVGMTRDGNTSGPNGVVVVNDGAELWVSDGDSTIKVVDLKSGRITATFATGGSKRANAFGFDPINRIVIVANSNDDPPFLSLISAAPGYKILARLPIAESAENLERSSFHAPSGMFYTAIPVHKSNPSQGLLAQTDSKNGKLVKLHQIDRCHPHSLSIVSDATIFLGCSTAHGPNPRPGGDMAIFDIASGKVEGYGADMGGNGGSTVNLKLGRYYHAATNSALRVVDIASRKLVQNVRTSPGSRSLGVNLSTGRVYVATTAKDGPCGGCILAYAPE
jgi:DNA-binding beta-propeller fold protein YncE